MRRLSGNGTWECGYCTFINKKPAEDKVRVKCSMCGNVTAIGPQASPQPAQPSPRPPATQPTPQQNPQSAATTNPQPQPIHQGASPRLPQFYHPNMQPQQTYQPQQPVQYYLPPQPGLSQPRYLPPGMVLMVPNGQPQQQQQPIQQQQYQLPQQAPYSQPQPQATYQPPMYYPPQQPAAPLPAALSANPHLATPDSTVVNAQQFFTPAQTTSDGLNWVCPQCRTVSTSTSLMCRGCRYSPPYFLPPSNAAPVAPNPGQAIQSSSTNPFGVPVPSLQQPQPAAPSISQPPPLSPHKPVQLQGSGSVPIQASSSSPRPPQLAFPPVSSSLDAPSTSPRAPDDALLSSKEMSNFVCPYDRCGASFNSLDLYTEHMILHTQEKDPLNSEERRKLAWYKEGYTGQYTKALQICYQNRQIGERRMLRMLEDLEKNTYKADVETRTKGILPLLKELYGPLSKYTCITSTGVDHYFTGLGDAGWGCGYRNIQMLSSYLIEFPSLKKALFTNVGFIPGVIAIQEAIENCWKSGFDPDGAKQFGGKLRDTKGMIGTTDAAALFRSFGIKMDVIDFYSKPLDKAVIQAQQEEYARDSSKKVIHFEPNNDLVDWVWKYYSSQSKSEKKKSKLFSKKFIPPLFLQHPGHSRTIVGVERNDKTGEIALLLFDPAHIGEVLKQDLKNGIGVNRFRKLVREFTHANYQIGVIRSADLLSGDDLEKSKSMDFAAEQLDADSD